MSGNRKLGKRTDQRKAMLRAMVTYLLENGQIKTTCQGSGPADREDDHAVQEE